METQELILKGADFESVLGKLIKFIEPRNIPPNIKLILEQRPKPGFGERLISKDITFPATVPSLPTSGSWTLCVKDFNTDVDFMIFRCDKGDEADTVKFIGKYDSLYVSKSDFEEIIDYLVPPLKPPAQDIEAIRERARGDARMIKLERFASEYVKALKQELQSENPLSQLTPNDTTKPEPPAQNISLVHLGINSYAERALPL